MTRTKVLLSACAATALMAGSASALTYKYDVTLESLNDSGVTGSGRITYDESTMMLNVMMDVMGLTPNQMHMAHIHGTPGQDSVLPTMEDDADGDGYIEVLEAVGKYGDIMLNLKDPATGQFAAAPGLGQTLSIDYTYDLTGDTDSDESNDLLGGLLQESYSLAEFGPTMLQNREVVFHGARVPGNVGAGTPGEVDGTAGYKGLLPVAAGEITLSSVPLPATLPLAGFAAAALGLFGARRKRS